MLTLQSGLQVVEHIFSFVLISMRAHRPSRVPTTNVCMTDLCSSSAAVVSRSGLCTLHTKQLITHTIYACPCPGTTAAYGYTNSSLRSRSPAMLSREVEKRCLFQPITYSSNRRHDRTTPRKQLPAPRLLLGTAIEMPSN